MKYTNKHNLPDVMVEVITADDYDFKPDPTRVSVTRLIDSPLIKRLTDIHAEEIESDVADMLWSMDGKATHLAMEKVKSTRWKKEERITETINGMTISGRLDLYDTRDKIVIDYKRTSVWSIIYKSKNESYENQLNLYAYLLRGQGVEVKKLEVYRMLRDWSRSDARKDPETYPVIPLVVIPVKLWSDKEAEDYLFERVRLHKEASTADPTTLSCTQEERWAKPDSWAVYSKTKDGKKFKERADRVLKSAELAQEYIDRNKLGGSRIEFRAGVDTRCQEYCSVSQFCPYWAKKCKESKV